MIGDMEKSIYLWGLIVAVSGWAVIEFILWLFSFVTITFK